MQINYFNPSELAESPKAEDFEKVKGVDLFKYAEDVRDYHNFMPTGAFDKEHDKCFLVCTRCGDRNTMPIEGPFPGMEGKCVRRLKVLATNVFEP